MEQRIVCAAIKLDEFVITGARHYDSVMRMTIDHYDIYPVEDWYNKAEQGFIDQKGNFLTREEAWIVAEKAGQIVRRVGGDEGCLFSENLY